MSREKDHFALKNFLKTKIGNKTHYYYEHPEDRSFRWEGTAWDKREARSKALDAYERHNAKKSVNEDAPANAVGGGNIAGLGVGPQGEPGRPPQLMPMARRGKKFMGVEPYIVSSRVFNQIREAKKKGKHWRTYLDEDDAFHHIRVEARKNKKGPIIIEDENTGAMCFVRYGDLK